ncbi:MAG: hypothetical protein K5792_08180 [Butyrivibrio sp.]|nr:hypothetical protein [Butyrivibrio sp.]
MRRGKQIDAVKLVGIVFSVLAVIFLIIGIIAFEAILKVEGMDEAIFPLLIFGFFFVVFGGIGFTILGVTASGEGKKKRLMENGRLIHAVVEGIELNTFITVNDMNPYNVFCGYVDPTTGEKIEFKSNNLYFNPNEFYELGSYIDVYVDQDNYKKYYVDVRNKALEGNYNM